MRTFRTHRPGLLALLLLAFALPAAAQVVTEPVDADAVSAIRRHGLELSGLEGTLQVMNDVYGMRLTGSRELDAASEWAAGELRELGLVNVGLEAWGPFGRGWTLNGFSVHARGDAFSFPVLAYPKAWSGPTAGRQTARLVLVNAETPEAVEAMADRIRGNVVLLGTERDLEEPFEPLATRHDEAALLALANWAPDPNPAEGGGRRYGPEAMERFQRQRAVQSAIFAAGPAAILDGSGRGDYGAIFVSAASVPTPADAPPFGGRVSAWSVDKPDVVPQFTLAIEHFNRLHRLVSGGYEVTVDFELDAEYYDDDPMEYNVVGEMPGTDPEIGDEVVMLGGHYDAWHAGTGMTDNAAGSATMMEVMRILKETYAELGKSPRRTIRIALWTGEEQGLLGSRGYVAQHFAETAGSGFMGGGGVTEVKPEHAKLSAYYNLDNGTGKIRGVYMQGNAAVEPIFRAWLQPFHDLDAATLTLQNTSGTDHLAFDAVGLPGFQFIQEPIAYGTRTHHSNMDVFDHGLVADLQQAATVIASFVYHTAERDELLPRKPLVRAEPGATSSR
jgi:hypothetical protein